MSPVNGQFYNGGEFIPDTGAYCGKGKNKVSRDEFARVAAAVAAFNAGDPFGWDAYLEARAELDS